MLWIRKGRGGDRNLRGFFAQCSRKQFSPSLGVGECLHQELHPRELVFGVAGHLPDSTPLVEADLRFFDRPDVSRCASFHCWRHAST